MRCTMIAAAGAAAMLAAVVATPAFAGYGAFALDVQAHKFGYSLNQPDQQHAKSLALKNCKSANCKVVFSVGPRQCAALATSGSAGGTGWGGAVKKTRDAAELHAVEDCQKRTAGQCKLRAAGCNH